MLKSLEPFLTVLLKFSLFTVYENVNRINYTSEVRPGYQGRVLHKSRTYPFNNEYYLECGLCNVYGRRLVYKACLVDNLLIRLIRPMSYRFLYKWS